jgi:hypothetical protein
VRKCVPSMHVYLATNELDHQQRTTNTIGHWIHGFVVVLLLLPTVPVPSQPLANRCFGLLVDCTLLDPTQASKRARISKVRSLALPTACIPLYS